jgi:hypothetical protein
MLASCSGASARGQELRSNRGPQREKRAEIANRGDGQPGEASEEEHRMFEVEITFGDGSKQRIVTDDYRHACDIKEALTSDGLDVVIFEV